MEDQVISPNEAGYQFASEMLHSGQLVAFPTETVYGLGGNALNGPAVMKIFEAKGRPTTDPLIVHVAKREDAYPLVVLTEQEHAIFSALGEAFWPGPLTVIVRAAECIPAAVTANTGMVGIRVPSHPIARRLLEVSGLPIAAPSANRFGHVSPTKFIHVLDDLGGKGVHVIDGDGDEYAAHTCLHGIESTVIKIDSVNKRIVMLRQGAVNMVQIRDVLGKVGASEWDVAVIVRTVKMHPTTPNEVISPENVKGEEAPGQAITHYAPNNPCWMVTSIGPALSHGDGVVENREVNSDDLASAVVVDFGGALFSLKGRVLAYLDLSQERDSVEAARQLFSALRWTESFEQAKLVLLADVSLHDTAPDTRDDLGRMLPGLADRMNRAASGIKVNLIICP
jgi:tRNA threonylcarbamoyl adenosine modification protein (Sua5/YciO/YrdC/YwlC family)